MDIVPVPAPYYQTDTLNQGALVRLKPNLPSTTWSLQRGDGTTGAPRAGAEGLQRSDFLTKAEILTARKNLHYRPGSIFLGRVDQQMIGVTDNRHIITLAGSRSGKSACVLVPNLLLYPGSIMVIDPKGELARDTAEHRHKALGQDVVILDPFGVIEDTHPASAYRTKHNPLREIDIDGKDEARDLIDDAAAVAEALVTETGGNDGYWTMAARNLVQAMVLATICKGEFSLPSVRDDLMRDAKGLTALFETMADYGPALDADGVPEGVRDAGRLIARVGASMRGRAENERANVVASAIEQLAFLESGAMRTLMSDHEVSLKHLKSETRSPLTIYLVMPAGRIGTHFRWLRLMISMALSIFERQSAKPEFPVLLILEEFAALGHLRPVEQAAGFIAGAHVRLWSVLQDLSQLKTHYKDGWETFIGNAGILQAFSLTDHTSLEYISKLLGETTVEVVTPQDRTTRAADSGDAGLRREFRTVPLLAPSEIAMVFRRLSENGSAIGGRSLVRWTDARPFIVDRVWWKELEPE